MTSLHPDTFKRPLQVATVNDRPATVMYINAAFEPVAPDDATMIKVNFTDEIGGVVFLVVPQDEASKSGRNGLHSKRGDWDESEHPRVPAGEPGGGQFTSSGGGGGGGSGPGKETEKPDADREGASQGRYGSVSRSYIRESPSEAERSRDVAAVHRISSAALGKAEKAGQTPIEVFHELTEAGSGRFHSAITAAKQASEFGAAVTAYPSENYEKMRLFLTPDGKSGFALSGADVVSVFKHPESKAKGFAQSALQLATQHGGRRLDCFDTGLGQLYSRSGFRAVARLAFNDEYKPDGWSYETFKEFNDGRPDVLFMVFDPPAEKYQPGDGQTVKDYDEGTQLQLAVLSKLSTIEGFSTGVKAKGPDAARAQARAWQAESPLKGDKVEEAMAEARLAQDLLSAAGRDIAATIPGVEFKDPGVKSNYDRIVDKFVARDRDASRVTDLARATFIVQTPEQARELTEALGKQFGVSAEGWRTLPTNYTDQTLNVRFPNGLIGEIQLMDESMRWAKSENGGGGHTLYVEQRAIDPPSKDPERWSALQAAQQALYGAALQNEFWQAALSGMGGS